MPGAVDYKLSDLLGIAGATIGIIIAGGILLQCISTKYVALSDRYRALAGEYRGDQASESRRGSLRSQITNYRRQILLLNSASVAIALALVSFLLTVAMASLSVIYPHAMLLRTTGTIGLMLGLVLIAVGVALELYEAFIQRFAITKEVEDFSDLPSMQDALR